MTTLTTVHCFSFPGPGPLLKSTFYWSTQSYPHANQCPIWALQAFHIARLEIWWADPIHKLGGDFRQIKCGTGMLRVPFIFPQLVASEPTIPLKQNISDDFLLSLLSVEFWHVYAQGQIIFTALGADISPLYVLKNFSRLWQKNDGKWSFRQSNIGAANPAYSQMQNLFFRHFVSSAVGRK